MREKGNDVNSFWNDFKRTALESGVKDTVAEWYVKWSEQFAKSIKGKPLRSRKNGHGVKSPFDFY